MPDVSAAVERLVADLDYPMYVATAGADQDRAGCLVGFATQASIHPPRLLVLISKANETFDVALRTDFLGVHFLGDDNHDLASLFGEESGVWTDKFARCEWHDGPSGVPVVAGVRGWLVGRVLERFDAGDHVAHLVEPTVGHATDAAPLMFKQLGDLEPGHPA